MKRLIFVAFSLVIIIGFQNCGGVRFENQGVSTGASVSASATSGNDASCGNDTTCLVSTAPTTETNERSVQDIVAACDQFALQSFVFNGNPQGSMRVVNREDPLQLNDVADLSMTAVHAGVDLQGIGVLSSAQDVRGEASIEADQIGTYVNFAANLTSIRSSRLDLLENGRSQVLLVANQLGRVLNIRGDLCAGFERADSVQNIRGDVALRGLAENGMADLELVLDTQGLLVLENVHLKRLQNHRGPVRLVNSVIDEQLNVEP